MANGDQPPRQGTTLEAVAPQDLPSLAVQAGDTVQTVKYVARDAANNVARAVLQTYEQATDVLSKWLFGPPNGASNQTIEDVARSIPQQKVVANNDNATPRDSQALNADPVDLATGQLVYRHTDLRLDGAGIPFEIARTYHSQARYPNGPLGAAWDYNLNLWLREDQRNPGVVVVNTGELREDRYQLFHPGGLQADYYALPEGYPAVLLQDQITGQFTLRRPDGLTYEYRELIAFDSNGKGLHRIERIRDRFYKSEKAPGNTLRFHYDNSDVPNQVTSIEVNDPTRLVTFDYDDLGRLVTVADYSGRVVHYVYDEYDDLVAVTLPATKDQPLGRTTFYEYSSDTGPVAHQLLSVVDAAGRRYLDVEYGNDDGLVDYARVVRQRDDQGEWQFQYANIVGEAPIDEADPNTVTRYTLTLQPNGHQIENWFNQGGNLLFKADQFYEESGVRQDVLWRYKFNSDGQLCASLSPSGVLEQDYYGRDDYMLGNSPYIDAPLSAANTPPTFMERLSFGNHLAHIRRGEQCPRAWPPVYPINDPNTTFADDIVQKWAYEPQFQLLASASDPRMPPPPTPGARQTFYAYINGALRTITHPATTWPDGTSQPPAVETFVYDVHVGTVPGTAGLVGGNHGRLLQLIDPVGHVTQHDYFPAGKKISKPEPSYGLELVLQPPSVSIEGYLHKTIVGLKEPDAAKTTFVVNRRGVPRAITDPRGAITERVLDSTDEPVQTKRTLKPGVAYHTTFKYTPQVKLRRQQRELLDDTGTPLPDGSEIRGQLYNDSEQLVRESLGSPDPTTWLATRHIYNEYGSPTRSISPGGSVTHLRYDPRRLVVATTLGFGMPEAVTDRIFYDIDGRKRAIVDGRGNVTRFDYDVYGRQIATTQIVDLPPGSPDNRPLPSRQGHVRLLTYDNLDNVNSERFFEWRAPNTYALLSRTSTEYDERGRAVKTIRDLFDNPILVPVGKGSLGIEGLKTIQPANSIPVETWLFLDGNGRVVEQRSGFVAGGPQASPGSSLAYTYDHSGRQTSAAIRLLRQNKPPIEISKTLTKYDLNGNPIRVDQFDYQIDTTGKVQSVEVISRAAEFDALNRKVTEIDGLGNRTSYRYDSRDLLIERMTRLAIRFPSNTTVMGENIRLLSGLMSRRVFSLH